MPGAHGVRGQGGSRMRRQAAVGRIGVLAVTPLLGMALAVVTAPPPAVAAGGPAGSAARLSSVPGGGMLFSVAATSERSAWAVGLVGRARQPAPLIERWSGGGWRGGARARHPAAGGGKARGAGPTPAPRVAGPNSVGGSHTA